VDGGAHWTFPCTSASINYQVFGQAGGTSWWLRSAGLSQLDNPNFNVQAITVDPFDTTRITLCGRAGVHQSRDGGATWHPAGNGACGGSNGGTVSNSVGIIVASSTGTVERDDIDYGGVHSTDHFTTVAQSGGPSGPAGVKQVIVGGHTYQVHNTAVPRDITRDGVSIADDFFRGAATNIRTMAVSTEAKPTIYVGLGAGGVLVGTP
jgi:hypothetical protein